MIDLIQKKEYRLSGLFDKVSTTVVDFEDEDIFTNLNFPKDYQKAQQRNQNG
jgi:molybdopterin-guanine dinucleotide biosynthesis protein A